MEDPEFMILTEYVALDPDMKKVGLYQTYRSQIGHQGGAMDARHTYPISGCASGPPRRNERLRSRGAAIAA